MVRRFTEEEAAARILASKARWRDRNRDRLREYDRERRQNVAQGNESTLGTRAQRAPARGDTPRAFVDRAVIIF